MEQTTSQLGSESILLDPPSKKNAIKLFHRIFREVKFATKKAKLEAFHTYIDDLATRGLVKAETVARWKVYNPWQTRPGPLE